jgi:DNA-binding transcriptional ArsR family regulator
VIVKKAENPAEVFAALGDLNRLRLIHRLSDEGPLSIAELSDGFKITRQAIRKHLALLESTGLVKGRRQGRANVFELEAKRLETARRFLDQIDQRWDHALERLQTLVEK